MKHYYDDAVKVLKDSPTIMDVYELETYTDVHEPFMRELKVIPLIKEMPIKVQKTLEDAWTKLAKTVKYVTKFYIIEPDDGKYQAFFVIGEGKNGNGNFVKDDMTNVLNVLNNLNESFADVACLEMQADRVDDVSDWLITFTI